jgi:DNA topoisomerase II
MDFESDEHMSESESDYFSDEENKPVPVAKKSVGKAKVATARKGSKSNVASGSTKSRNVLGINSNNTITESNNNDSVNVAKPKSNKTIEEIYQKKTQLEHILLRPDTYSK